MTCPKTLAILIQIPILQTTLALYHNLDLPSDYSSKETPMEAKNLPWSRKTLFVAPWKVNWVTALEKKIKIPIVEKSPTCLLPIQSSLCPKFKILIWLTKVNTEAIPTDFNPWKSWSTMAKSSARSTAMKEERIQLQIIWRRRICWNSRDQVNSSYKTDKETKTKKTKVSF